MSTSPSRTRRIVIALAAAAGVTIENARLYEEAEQRQGWLSATAEIAAVLADPALGAERPADRRRPGSLRGRRRPGVDRHRAGRRRRLELEVVSGVGRGPRHAPRGLDVRVRVGAGRAQPGGGHGQRPEHRARRRRPVRRAGTAAARPRHRRAARDRVAASRALSRWPGCPEHAAQAEPVDPGAARPASPSRRPSPSSWPGPGRTSSVSRSSRTGTGSVATCTTWSSSACSRSVSGSRASRAPPPTRP